MIDKATYIAEVSYNDKTKAESRKLPALPRMLHFNFLGYSLMNSKKRQEAFHYPESSIPNGYNCRKMSKTEGYSTTLSGLDDGYIYILYENKPDLFVELKVELYQFTYVAWDTSDMDKLPDIRTPKAGTSLRYYPVPVNAGVLSVAYSQFQWSGKYIKKIRNDQKYRYSRMQQFDTNKLKNRQAQDDAFDINSVQLSFLVEQGDTRPRKVDGGAWIADFKNRPEASMLFQYWVGTFDRAENKCNDYNAGETDTYVPDVFIALDDPFGCASMLIYDLYNQFRALNQLVVSIQGDPESRDEAYYLFLHTATMYQLFYNKKSNKEIKKLSKHTVSEAFFNRLLLKNKRDAIRNEITVLREKLLKFMDGSYYLMPAQDIEFQNGRVLPEAQNIVFGHTAVLAQCPYNYDRYISVEHDAKCKRMDDKVQKYVMKMLTDKSHPIAKTYVNEIFIDENNAMEYISAVSESVMSILSSLKDDIFEDVKIVYKKALSKYRFGSQTNRGNSIPLFIMGKKELRKLLADIDVDADKLRFYGSAERVGRGQSGVNINALGLTEFDDCLMFNTPKGLIGKASIHFDRFTSSNSFLGVVSFFAVYNLASGAFYKKEDGISKNGLKGSVILAELTTYTMAYATKYSKSLHSATRIGLFGQIAGVVGTGLSGIVAVFDAIEATEKNDYDAAIAYYCSGAAFLLSTALSYYSLQTGTRVVAFTIRRFKFSWISLLFLMGLVATIVAIWRTDTPIQHYLKHFILSERTQKLLGSSSRSEGRELMNQLIVSKNRIVGNEWAAWRNLEESYNEYQKLSCVVKMEQAYPQFLTKMESYPGMNVTTHILGTISIAIPFCNLMPNANIELMIVCYQNGKLQWNKKMQKESLSLQRGVTKTSWGEVTVHLGGDDTLHVDINGNFYDNLDLDTSHLHLENNKFYLCCKIIGDNNYYKSQEQNSAGKIQFPSNNQYIVNKITPVYAAGNNISTQSEILNYFNYISRDDKLVLSLDELTKKEANRNL